MFSVFSIGVIPDSICLSQQLIGVTLSKNLFHGPVPACIGALTSLSILWMNNNMLSGEIPASLANCRSLWWQSARNNYFTGHFPAGLASLPLLARLRISNNSFDGDLPSFAAATSLRLLDISYNHFSGAVNTDLALLSSLQLQWLHADHNRLTSAPMLNVSIANGHCQLRLLSLSHNHITEVFSDQFVASCAGSLLRLQLQHNNFWGSISTAVCYNNSL